MVQAELLKSELATAPGVTVIMHEAPASSVPVQVLLLMLVPRGKPEVFTDTFVALTEPVFSIVICRGLPVSAAFTRGELIESAKVETLGISV